MAYTVETFSDGKFAVDWDLVRTVLRSNVISHLQLQHGTERTESHWFGPDLHYYEVDWDAVNGSKEVQTDQFYEEFGHECYAGSIVSQKNKLKNLAMETASNKQMFFNKLHAAQTKSLNNVEQSVDRYDNAITAAKITRDMSKEIVIIGATVLTGGAAKVAITAADAALDAGIEFQDNGNGSAALVTFAGKFAIGLIPGGNTAGEAVAMAVIKAEKEAVLAGTVALVQGKKPAEAMTAAIVGGAGSGVGSAVGVVANSSGFQKMLKNTAYPMTVKLSYTGTVGASQFAQRKAAREFTTGVAGKATSTAYNKMVTKPTIETAINGLQPQGSNGVAPYAVFPQTEIADRAIIGPLAG